MASWVLPASVLSRARREAAAIEDHIGSLGGRALRVDADEIVTGRAAVLGLDPPTRISAGGASRLLATADGWCAVTMSRVEDYEALPALLEMDDVGADPWNSLATAAAARNAEDLVARARLLDVPAAVLGEITASDPKSVRHTAPLSGPITDLLVADMSSMWAGPLCGRLLAAAGATVVKVEAPGRPDGTRSGDRRFFDWMNSEKLCYAGDVAGLLGAADVVIEASRPSALRRRGLGAEQVPARPGRIWLRISGYGPSYPERVAFGDDAAVAGGLVGRPESGPVFCGDAIADPLGGLASTVAVLDALTSGGGVIVDVAMSAVAATYAVLADTGVQAVEPRLPALPPEPAHELGADNVRVRELVESRLAAC